MCVCGGRGVVPMGGSVHMCVVQVGEVWFLWEVVYMCVCGWRGVVPIYGRECTCVWWERSLVVAINTENRLGI